MSERERVQKGLRAIAERFRREHGLNVYHREAECSGEIQQHDNASQVKSFSRATSGRCSPVKPTQEGKEVKKGKEKVEEPQVIDKKKKSVRRRPAKPTDEANKGEERVEELVAGCSHEEDERNEKNITREQLETKFAILGLVGNATLIENFKEKYHDAGSWMFFFDPENSVKHWNLLKEAFWSNEIPSQVYRVKINRNSDKHNGCNGKPPADVILCLTQIPCYSKQSGKDGFDNNILEITEIGKKLLDIIQFEKQECGEGYPNHVYYKHLSSQIRVANLPYGHGSKRRRNQSPLGGPRKSSCL